MLRFCIIYDFNNPNGALLKYFYILATFFVSLSTSSLQANSSISPSLSYGQAKFFGTLNKPSKTQPLWGFSLSTLDQRAYDRGSLGGRFGMLNLEIDSIDAKNDNTDFPFNQNANLSLLSIAVIPNFCFLGQSPIQACLGIGLNLLQVSDSDNLQSYGTFRYSISIGRLRLSESGLVTFLRVNGIFPVYQTINRQNSSFSYLSLSLGLGWQFDLSA